MNEPNYAILADKVVSLKQTWIKAEPWLPDVLSTLYKEFQECRAKLLQDDGSDKDRILAQHYYTIAIFYKYLFDRYPINLLTSMKYLEISKNFSKNLTKNETFFKNCEILTQQIDANCNSLENQFEVLYQIDWIKYCIALGTIDDIELCFEDINDTFDKEQLAQLRTTIQNIQLLQIINNLEDDILISVNDNICIVFERYNMLSKAYDISGEETISKYYAEKAESFFDQSLRDTDEDEDNKESINDIILKEVKSSVEDELLTLSEIIENITNKNQIEIFLNIDAIIIERHYIKYCLKFWYDEVEDFFNTLIETKNYKIIEEIIATIFGVKNFLEIPKHFKNLKYYSLLEKHYKLIPINVERDYISRLNKDFSDKTRGYLKKLENECKLFEKFFNFLNNIKCFRDVIKNLELENFCNDIINFNDVIRKIFNLQIASEYQDIYDELKEIANNFVICQNIFLKDKFQEMIKPYLENVEIKIQNSDDRKYVEVKGKIIIISEILEQLCNELSDQSVKEVQFIATNTIHIDDNLVKDIWHGINIVILTKKLIVHGSNVEWNVSGLDNNHKYTTNAGTDENGDGKCGANGCPGESGGNVLIEADECENDVSLCIISNGGNGSKGQDGGDGIDGKDGHGISYEDFKTMFPGAAQSFSSESYDKTIKTILSTASHTVNDKHKDWLLKGHHRYIEAILPHDNEIIFSYYSSKIFVTHVFLLYKGSLGEPGGCGGENGLGGQSGFGGEICADILNIRQISERGNNGDDGNCGLYGSHGKNGFDVAYADYSPDPTNSWPIPFGKDNESKLDVKCYNDSGPNRVWCEKNKMYIEIDKREMEPVTSRNFFERRLNSRRYAINRDHNIMAIKKKSISKNDIKEKYSNLFEITENEIIKQMKSNMENARTRALQTVCEETEQKVEESIQINVHRKSNFSVNQKKSNKKKISLQSKFKRNKSYQNILSKIKNEDKSAEIQDIDNWYQLKSIPLKYNEMQETFTNFYELKDRYQRNENQNENVTKKLENIYKILIIKYRFAVFEEIVKKYKFDNSKEENQIISNDIITRSLIVVKDKDARHAITHTKLGRLHQYIFNDSLILRQQIIDYLKERKVFRKYELMASIKAFVLIDGEYDKRSPVVDKYFENFQKFDKERSENIAKIQQEFDIQLKRCGLYEKYNENEDRMEFEKLLQQKGLSDLYKKLNVELDSVFDWNACIKDKEFYKAYEKHIQTKDFSEAYFQLLSKLFEVNIVICEENDYNRYVVIKNINDTYKRKLYLLYLDNIFVELETDKNWKMLLMEQKNIDIVYGEILSKFLSLTNPEDLDTYLKNEEYKSVQSNVVRFNPITSNSINIDDIIEYFSSSNEKKLLKNRLHKIQLLSKNNIILEIILSRFSFEGGYISINELISLIDDILMSYIDNDKWNIFIWILQAWPQNCWTNEFLIITIENYIKHRLNRKDKIRDYLMGIDNKEILLLFKIKLEKLNNQNRITLECIENIFYLLSNIDTEIYNLEDLSLNEWPFALKDSYWQSKLKRLLKSDSDDDKNSITTICYNIQQLENTFGKASIEDFLEMVKGKISIPQLEKILKILLRLDNNVWAFDKSINFQNSESIERYIENLDNSYMVNNSVRDISELCEIVSNNANTSQIILSNLSYIETQFNLIQNDSFNFQYIESVHDILKEKDIKSWVKLFKTGLNESPPEYRTKYIRGLRFEMLVVIDKGIEMYKKFNLRGTQKLAILSMILNEFECKDIRNTLAQVSTGEGKTFIVLAITIMKALCGQKVDVITSSSVLAKRDADFENKEIYKLFDITVSHNCNESIEKRKKAYSENQVIYGDLGNFQRDYLLDHFYMLNILGDRNFENVIVDEVDSMLLDKGNNMLYISHEICGLDKLESVYIYIWQRINRPARTSEEFMYNFNVKLIKDEILNDIFGVVKVEDIADIDSELDSKQIDKIWKILFDSNIIDGKGKLVVQNTITNSNNIEFADLLKKQELFHYKARIEFLINEKITRERLIHVPNYLNAFIEDHLESWIKSALCALCMQESHNYVVDVDRTETSSDINPNIIIIDNDTGTDQNNSQWDNCLHQFLQLKHGCKLSMQSLKAVFISNVTYLKLYENLYGLTGTLGSEQERDLLKEIHNVNFVTIPTARPSKFIEFESQICCSEKDWIEKIVTNTKEMIRDDQQSVLIICETVENVRKISKAFAGGDVIPEKLHTYTRDFEEFSVAKENFELGGGHVIVATNLAGRGTDIKISEELNKSGGLHVCLTYLPANERIEQQAYGRAARKGERGSGILIIQSSEMKLTGGTNFEVVYDLKQKRDFEELHRVSEIKNYYDNHIVHEENCFQKFQEQYKNLRSLLDEKQIHKDIKAILLGATLDRWAFWLDENNKFIKDFSDQEIKLRFDESIDNFIKTLECLSCDPAKFSEWVIDFPVQAIRLGITFLGLNRDYLLAIYLFDEIITNDPKFCEAAHYFKAYALKKQNQNPYQLIEEELLNAAKLFEEHSNNAAYASAIINKMKERNKCHFVQSDAFIKQKENICNIYNKYIESIDHILGYRMTSEKFTNGTDISDELAELLFNDMITNGILLKPKIDHNSVHEKDIEKIALDYGISFDILDDLIIDMDGKEIDNMINFQEVLETSITLPSREDFWKKLIDKKILSNEIEYVVIDTDKLKSIDSVLADTIPFKIRKKEFNKQTFSHIANNQLILYSEQLNQENTMILKRDDFLKIVEFDKYETLQRVGVFCLNNSANIKVDQEFFFDIFDSVTVNDIAKENITITEANTIFKILVEQNIIRNVNGVYRLAIPFYDLNKINLNGYSIYKNTVVALLNLCFIYRIALEKIYNDLNNKRNNTQISLMAKPHRQLIFDLIEKNIIKSATVKINMDYNKRLKAIYNNNNFDFYRNQLRDDTSLSLIAEILEKSGRKLENKRSWHLKPILELFGSNEYGNVQEIHMFTLNGLQHIIDLEQKWTWKMLLNCFIVILIGIASIVIGSLFETFSAGALSFVGLEFLGEGINDITFAIGALRTGYFSWKDYGQHKARSLLLTIITAGVGVFLTKAFRISRYGYRVVGTGSNNIKEIPNTSNYRILLQSALNEIRSGIENGNFRGRNIDATATEVNVPTSRIIYNDVEKIMKNITSGMLDNIGNVIFNHNMPSVFDKTFEILGREKTRNLIDEITELYLSKPYLFDRLLPITGKLTNCMKKIVTEVSSVKNFGKKVLGGKVSAIDVVDEVLKWTTKAKDIQEISEMINDILIDLNSEINSKCNNVVVKSVTVTNTRNLKAFKQEIFQNWNKELKEKIRQILTQEMINPVLENANKTLNQSSEKNVGKSVHCKNGKETKLKYYMKFGKIKKGYIKILEPKISEEHKLYVDNYIIQKYQRILMLLLAKSKSPKLFSAIISENVPMDFACLKTSTIIIPCMLKDLYNIDVVGIKIIVKQDNGLSHEFCSVAEGEALTITFELSKDYFPLENDDSENSITDLSLANKNVGNDCLFNALLLHFAEKIPNITIGEFRNRFANFIQNYKWTKYVIVGSYDWLKSKKSNQMNKDPECGQSSNEQSVKNFGGSKIKRIMPNFSTRRNRMDKKNMRKTFDSVPSKSKNFGEEYASKNFLEKLWSYVP